MAGKKIAVFVVHGVGSQRPFETLGQFVEGLDRAIRKMVGQPDVTPTFKHGRLKTVDNGKPWNSSFVSLAYPEELGYATVDVHEYYWAYKMTGQVGWSEIKDWLKQTSERAKIYYDQNTGLMAKKAESAKRCSHSPFNEQGLFKKDGYLKAFAPYLQYVMPAVGAVSRAIEGLLPSAWWKGLTEFAAGKLDAALIPTVGTVAAYTQQDPKSPFFTLRSDIIGTGIGNLRQLLRADSGYDHVIVVGHSLGTAISVDILNRLDRESPEPGIDYKKFAALFTFGSPLDKIAFFFRDLGHAQEPIRSQLVEQLHGYLAHGSAAQAEWPTLHDDVQGNLIRTPLWMNYFGCEDPISGHLDFYKHVENVRLEKMSNEKMSALNAHSSYWTDDAMYNSAIAALAARSLL